MVKEKNDSVIIDKILKCINIILNVSKDKSIEEIQNNEIINSTIMFQLILIGEYTTSLSDEYKLKKENIPWNKIKGLRNNIVHDYGGIIYSRLYNTIKNDLPQLKEELENEI